MKQIAYKYSDIELNPTTNKSYKLVSDVDDLQRKYHKIVSHDIDRTLTRSQATNGLKNGLLYPYLGRACFLCEQTNEAFASTIQKNRVMWCVLCNRTFYHGRDFTDYSKWENPNVEDDMSNLRRDGNSLLTATGLAETLTDIGKITKQPIDVSDVTSSINNLDQYLNHQELYFDPNTKQLLWNHPDIKLLNNTYISSAGKIVLSVLFSAILLLALYQIQ